MSDARDAYESLAAKQRRFVDAYFEYGFNGTQAVIEAGYSENGAAVQATRLLRNAKVKAAISERLDEAAMPANEVLARLADIARSDIGDLLTLQQREMKGATGEDETVEWAMVNLAAAKRAGLTRYIKSITWTNNGPKLELHDAMAALVNIGKAHGLFVERQEVTGKDGGPIQVEDARARLAQLVARTAERTDD